MAFNRETADRPAMMTEGSIADILARAEALCRGRGARLTDARRRTLRELAKRGRPVKAYDLLPALGSNGKPAKPATVYRALEFLESYGLVHRVAGINAFMVCTHGGGAHTTSLFICERCGGAQEHTMEHPTSCPPPPGFTVHTSVHEHYGLCGDCASA